MERRKDSKGKVLKDGESQRKDGRYQYRWADSSGKRKTIYANTLNDLRKKEEEVKDLERNGINVSAQSMTVESILCNYASVHKASLKPTSAKGIDTGINIVKSFSFSQKPVAKVSTTDAKLFMKQLHDSGYSYGTINNIKGLLRPAFELACADRLISRNPFSFALSKVVPKETREKKILSEDQYARLISFCRSNSCLMYHVDEIIILHETGLRIGEFCGLTLDDIDLDNGTVNVNHQLVIVDRKNAIQTPKTKKGFRIIPMSAEAKKSFARLIVRRPPLEKEEEPVIDGYSGFLQISFGKNRASPRSVISVELNLKKAITEYNKANPEDQIPLITPHSLRHMFCTRMVQSGMNIKTTQYLMGHSDVGMTLNVYSHISAEKAIQEFILLQNTELSSPSKTG